jgi:hypothetical protein
LASLAGGLLVAVYTQRTQLAAQRALWVRDRRAGAVVAFLDELYQCWGLLRTIFIDDQARNDGVRGVPQRAQDELDAKLNAARESRYRLGRLDSDVVLLCSNELVAAAERVTKSLDDCLRVAASQVSTNTEDLRQDSSIAVMFRAESEFVTLARLELAR